MTSVYFVRHAEPNYENHDDRLSELLIRYQISRKHTDMKLKR